MKYIRPIPALLCGMISAIAVISPCDAAEEYDVYLLAGQSNMDGRGLVRELPEERKGPLDNAIIFYRNEKRSSLEWKTLAPGFSIPPRYKGDFPSPTFGPEIGFVHALHQRTPQRKIALIKGAQGGTSLRADWKPGEKGVPAGQGRQYSDFVETIQVATKQLSERGDRFTIRGLLWHQGESDARSGTDTYSRRLKELIARLREDLDLPHLPVVVGEVFDNGKRDNVRTATQNVARDSPNVELVTSDGTTTSDPGTHFDTKSQLLLGERYAEAIIALQQVNTQCGADDLSPFRQSSIVLWLVPFVRGVVRHRRKAGYRRASEDLDEGGNPKCEADLRRLQHSGFGASGDGPGSPRPADA